MDVLSTLSVSRNEVRSPAIDWLHNRWKQQQSIYSRRSCLQIRQAARTLHSLNSLLVRELAQHRLTESRQVFIEACPHRRPLFNPVRFFPSWAGSAPSFTKLHGKNFFAARLRTTLWTAHAAVKRTAKISRLLKNIDPVSRFSFDPIWKW